MQKTCSVYKHLFILKFSRPFASWWTSTTIGVHGKVKRGKKICQINLEDQARNHWKSLL